VPRIPDIMHRITILETEIPSLKKQLSVRDLKEEKTKKQKTENQSTFSFYFTFRLNRLSSPVFEN